MAEQVQGEAEILIISNGPFNSVRNEDIFAINPIERLNHDKDVMPDLRKLRPHPTARFADDLPPVELIAKYVQPTQGVANSTHWFWTERKGIRRHDIYGQATMRWHGRTYNVARVLLQHQRKARVVRAVNTCGLPQCVKPEHWSTEPSFLGAVSASPGLAAVRVGDAWRLSSGGDVVRRDMAFVAAISQHGRDYHVVRALHEERETVFLTACGLLADPAAVVASETFATCKACLQ